MDRHVASLLAMTNKRGFIAFTIRRLGVGPSSRNDWVKMDVVQGVVRPRQIGLISVRIVQVRHDFFPTQFSRERTQRAQRWVRVYGLFAIFCG
jgi:hypothetical protein